MTRARDVANLIGSGNYSSTTFTATAGQTAFSISHTQGFVQVFMNGLLLDETADYTSNGSAVTLTSGAAAGDEIEVVAYNTFSVGDALPKSGGTMSGALTVDAAAATVLTVDRATNDGTVIDVQKDGSSVGSIVASGGTTVYTGNSHGIMFNGAKAVPSNSSGTRVDNAVDLGSSSYRYKDLYLSGGAYIGGTGSANHLDDYETGTFTLTVSGESGGSGVGYGAYIKVGNVCHFNWYSGTISITSTPSAYLGGLPFTCVALTNGAYPAVTFAHNTWTSNVASGYVNIGTTNIYPTANNSSGGAATATGSKYVMCSGSYQVA
tara:strand:- start:732 stop:1694 length:963 start_codon:yes stop_codon:yes gene_type:complete